MAHMASIAAFGQGKFWEFHDKIFENPRKLNKEQYIQYANELGLDVERFTKDIDSAKGQPLITADTAEAIRLGATGTPAFFVNGRYLSGAKPFKEFAAVIDRELARLKIPNPAAAAGAGG